MAEQCTRCPRLASKWAYGGVNNLSHNKLRQKCKDNACFFSPHPINQWVNIFNHLGTFISFLSCWEISGLCVFLEHLCLSLLSSFPYFLFQVGEECPAGRISSYLYCFFVDHSIQGTRQKTNLPDIFQTWSVMGMWTCWALRLGIWSGGGFQRDSLSCVYLKMLKNHNLVCLSWKCFNVLALRHLSFLKNTHTLYLHLVFDGKTIYLFLLMRYLFWYHKK